MIYLDENVTHLRTDFKPLHIILVVKFQLINDITKDLLIRNLKVSRFVVVRKVEIVGIWTKFVFFIPRLPRSII